MRHPLARTLAVVMLFGVLAACAAPAVSPTPTVNAQAWPSLATRTRSLSAISATATPIPRGSVVPGNEITSAALANNLIGDPATRSFSVYLPPGYNTGDSRYPVVYVLQGFTGGVMFRRLAGRLDELIAAGEAREMILVFFNGANRFDGSWYASSPTIGDYETFIAEELVSLVDSSYRTLPTRDSRGITGCSMGGYGSLHLAFKFPDVFSVAAPMSGLGSDWEPSQVEFTFEPEDFADLRGLPLTARVLIAEAAVAAPNPDNPPFYLDMPYEFVGGEPHAVPAVFQEINTFLNPANEDLPGYLDQPIRLNGLMIYQDTNNDPGSPDMEAAREFDRTLTQMGVEHEFIQVEASHCGGDWTPILEFISDRLAY